MGPGRGCVVCGPPRPLVEIATVAGRTQPFGMHPCVCNTIGDC